MAGGSGLVSGTALGSHSFSSAISGPRYSRIAPFTTCTLLTLGGHCVTKGGEVTPGGSNTDYRWAPGPPCAAEQKRNPFSLSSCGFAELRFRASVF